MLWNLDPCDPMHTIFNLEYSGLKNCTFVKLLEFLHTLPSSYQNMPHILYTRALYTCSFAHPAGGSEEESTVLLTNALYTFVQAIDSLLLQDLSFKETSKKKIQKSNDTS